MLELATSAKSLSLFLKSMDTSQTIRVKFSSGESSPIGLFRSILLHELLTFELMLAQASARRVNSLLWTLRCAL